MRLGGTASYVSEVNERQEIPGLVAWAAERKLPIIMIGGGSNIIWRDEGFNGLLLINKLTGIESNELDDQAVFVTAGGGENWDQIVSHTVELGLSGLELLSLIPGTVGGAPVQNIGAYGCQLSDVLATIEAFDLSTQQFVTLRGSECEFGYRTSRFKTTDRNRFLITGVTLQLSKTATPKEAYHSLKTYLDSNNITEPSPANILSLIHI